MQPTCTGNPQRNAVVLFYVDDMAVNQISEVLAVSSGTVKKALFNLRKNLARSLGRPRS